MKILYKLTTRSRPDKMFKCVRNIREAAVEENPWIIVTLDKNDSTLQQSLQLLDGITNVFPVIGPSKNKIDAFNRDIPAEGWDIIVATSDDIKFFRGFDKQIEKDALAACLTQMATAAGEAPTGEFKIRPKDIEAVIWYEDGYDHGKILTVPIMTKKYYDRLGYVYNPIYINLWCDEEAIHVGEKLGKIFYSSAKIMEHMHPAWGKGDWDEQYRRTNSTYYSEKVVFDKRKAAGFPL